MRFVVKVGMLHRRQWQGDLNALQQTHAEAGRQRGKAEAREQAGKSSRIQFAECALVEWRECVVHRRSAQNAQKVSECVRLVTKRRRELENERCYNG